jgi:hypothetical protein
MSRRRSLVLDFNPPPYTHVESNIFAARVAWLREKWKNSLAPRQARSHVAVLSFAEPGSRTLHGVIGHRDAETNKTRGSWTKR